MTNLLQTKSSRKVTEISKQEVEGIRNEIDDVLKKIKSMKSNQAIEDLVSLRFGSIKNSLLHLAVKFDHLKAVKTIIKICDGEMRVIDGKNSNSLTPLHFAAIRGSVRIAQILIESGSTLNLQASEEKRGWAPIHYAAKYDQLEILELLISKGDDQESQTSFGLTPAMIATEFGNIEVVDFLIRKKGANKNAQTHAINDRMNILHYAVVDGHLDIVKYLLNAGVERNSKTISGISALDFAARIDNVEIATLLLSWGVHDLKNSLEVAKNSHSYKVLKLIEKYILVRKNIFSKRGFFTVDVKLLNSLKSFNDQNLTDALFHPIEDVYFNAYGILSLKKLKGIFSRNQKSFKQFLSENNFQDVLLEFQRVNSLAESKSDIIPFI